MALYRKYRPATFAEVVGQEHVTEPLSAALRSGRINHAFLFSGPRGCGKTSSARILARSLNCVEGPTPTPCGVCDSCVALAPGGPGNLDVIELDAASHGNVDDTRELREKAFFAPANSRYRVLIIDEAHMVSHAGFNALLKIVEEPPEHLIFIFATTEPEKVLPTIKSRTHHYPFRLLTPSAMRGLVERICDSEQVTVEPAVFPLVIRQGGGSPRDTLSVLDQLVAGSGPDGVSYAHAAALLGVTEASLLDGAVDALAARDGAALFRTVDRVIEVGHDPRRFVTDLLQRLRDIIMVQSVPQAVERGLVDAPGEEAETLARQAEQLGPATLSRLADEVHAGLDSMRGATSPRLLLEILCARLLLPEAEESFAALSQRVEQLERGAGPVATGAAPATPRPQSQTPDAPTGQTAGTGDDGAAPRYVRPSQRRAQQAAQAAQAATQPAPQQKQESQPEPAPSTPESAQDTATPPRPQPQSSPEPQPAADKGPEQDRAPEPQQQSPAADDDRREPAAETAPAPPSAAADTEQRPEPAQSRSPQSEEAVERPAAEREPGVDAPRPARTGHAASAVAAAADSWGEAAEPGADQEPAARGADRGTESEPQPEQTPETPAKPLDSEQVRASWPEVRRAVRERSRTLEVMLADAAVARVDGTDLVLTHKTAALANRLNEPHHSRVIAEALGAVFGGQWTSRAEHANAAAAPAGPAQGRAPQRAFAPESRQPVQRPPRQAPDQGRGQPVPQPETRPEQPQTPPRQQSGGEERQPTQRRAEQRPEAQAAPEEPERSTDWSDGVPLPEEPPAEDMPPEEAHDPRGFGGASRGPAAGGQRPSGPADAAPSAGGQSAGTRRLHWSERAAAHAAAHPPAEAAPQPDPAESMPEVTEQDMIEEARSGPHNMDHRTPEEMALALLQEHLGAVPLD